MEIGFLKANKVKTQLKKENIEFAHYHGKEMQSNAPKVKQFD